MVRKSGRQELSFNAMGVASMEACVSGTHQASVLSAQRHRYEFAIKDSYAPQESNTVGHRLIILPGLAPAE